MKWTNLIIPVILIIIIPIIGACTTYIFTNIWISIFCWIYFVVSGGFGVIVYLEKQKKQKELTWSTNVNSRLLEEGQERGKRLVEMKKTYAFDLRIRRCIVGGKGSGKTYFLVNGILPELDNYFVFCIKHEISNIYDFVDDENKYCLDKVISSFETEVLVLKKIEENKGKTIIIDDYELLTAGGNRILGYLVRHRYNYIIVINSEKIAKECKSYFNLYYSFYDNIELGENTEDSVIHVEKDLNDKK